MNENSQKTLKDEVEDEKGDSYLSLEINGNNIQIRGSERFIQERLEYLVEEVDLESSTTNSSPKLESNSASTKIDSQTEQTEEDIPNEIIALSESINVDSDLILEHFDVRNGKVKVNNPLEIEKRWALVGYCAIKKEVKGENKFDNAGIKNELENQMIDVSGWGNLVYNSREADLIEYVSNNKQSYKPFKVTTEGLKRFREWLMKGETS